MKRFAFGAFGLLGLLWGSNFIFVKWALNAIDPAQITLLRVVFGFIPLVLCAVLTRSLRWCDLRHSHHFIAMAILATSFFYYSFAKGTLHLSSGLAGMISGATPLFTFLVAWCALREQQVDGRSIGGILIGFVGVLIIARPWSGGSAQANLPGILWMIAGSVSLGCAFVYARKFIVPLHLTPLVLTTYQIGFSIVVLGAVTPLDGIENIFTDRKALTGLILGLGILGTGVAFILYYFLVEKLGSLSAASVTYIPPVVALLIGAFWAGESVHIADVLAMVIILCGLGLLQTSPEIKKTPESSNT